MYVKLTSYAPVRVVMPAKAVDDRRVNERVNEIVSQIPTYVDAGDEPVAEQDRVRVRVTLREDGVALPGLDGATLTVTPSDGFLPQAVSDALLGMMPGDAKHVEWDAALAGEGDEGGADGAGDGEGGVGAGAVRSVPAEADVEVLSVRKRVRPEMTDAWVARCIPRCSTLEEFFGSVREQLQEEADARWVELKRERCALALTERLDGAPALEDVSRAVEGVRGSFDRMLAREGKVRAEKARELGMSEEELDAALMRQGALAAAQGQAVRLMSEHLGIEASQSEVDAAIARMARDERDAARLGADAACREKAAAIARYEKALDFVVGQAEVVEEDPAPAGSAAAFGVPGRWSAPYPNPFA